MNNYEEEAVMPNIIEEPEESIASIVRDNSNKISSVFANVCNVVQFLSGKPAERDLKGNEPKSLKEEVLWQRSMLCRIEEELYDIDTKLGV